MCRRNRTAILVCLLFAVVPVRADEVAAYLEQRDRFQHLGFRTRDQTHDGRVDQPFTHSDRRDPQLFAQELQKLLFVDKS